MTTENIKQQAATTARADHQSQWDLAWKMLGTIHPNESEILIALERKFFLNRKQSQAIYDEVHTYEIENADCMDVD